MGEDQDDDGILSIMSEDSGYENINDVYVPSSKAVFEEQNQLDATEESLFPVQDEASAGSESVWKTIAYKMKNVVDIPVELNTLNGLFTASDWQNLLSDEERRELKQYLPDLTGWNGLTEDEALLKNLDALFQGENFNFGNPIEQFTQRILKGWHTPQGARRIYAQQMEAKSKFYQAKHEYSIRLRDVLREQCHSIARQKQLTQEIFDSDEESVDFQDEEEGILTAGTSLGQRIDPKHSLFLAIKACLSGSSTPLHLADVYDWIEQNKADAIPPYKKLPVYMDQKRFLEAALIFLHDPQVDHEIWGQSVVGLDENQHSYSWKGYQLAPKEEDIALQMLEQLFYTPPAQPLRFPVAETARSQAERDLKPEIEKTMSGKFQEAKKVTTECNWTLSAGLVGSCPDLELKYNLEQYQMQEWRRFNSPYTSFLYKDTFGSVAMESHVDAVIPKPRTAQEENILVPTAPAEVSMLNLVRDSVARLPKRQGTRVDIRNMLRQSQYIRVSSTDAALNTAIFMSLEELSRGMDPPVQFNAGLWQYRHGDRDPSMKDPVKLDRLL